MTGQLDRPGVARLVGAVVPPLLLAVAGLVHPMALDAGSAERWTVLHLVLLPIFPLLALGPWLAARGRSLRRTTLALGFVYAVFYGALDVLAGVGTGTLVTHGMPRAAEPLFAMGNALSLVGVAAYALAAVLTCADHLRRHRLPALPGTVIVIASSLSFLSSHIYWPRGVLTMLGFAVGWGLLVAADSRSAASVTDLR